MNAKETPLKWYDGNLREIQFKYDRGEKDNAYHLMQMTLEKETDPQMKSILEFFFFVWQYLEETDPKFLQHLYQSFQGLSNLPPHLNEHRYLFLMRLEKILGHQVSSLKHKLTHPSLIAVYDKEMKLKPFALKM